MRHALVVLLTGALCLSQRTNQAPADLATAIDAIAADALKQPVAGLSIAVARRGHPLIARGYGTANVDGKMPVTRDTVFHIASISKNIAAAAALKLVAAGRLGLDEDVRKYVPEAPTHGQ